MHILLGSTQTSFKNHNSDETQKFLHRVWLLSFANAKGPAPVAEAPSLSEKNAKWQ